MSDIAQHALRWLQENPLYVWGAISAVLNVARHYRWLDRLEQTRWGGALLDLVRALGLDPVGVLRFFSILASSKAAALGAGVLLPPHGTDRSPPTPRDPGAAP